MARQIIMTDDDDKFVVVDLDRNEIVRVANTDDLERLDRSHEDETFDHEADYSDYYIA